VRWPLGEAGARDWTGVIDPAGAALDVCPESDLDGLSNAEARARRAQTAQPATGPAPGRAFRDILARNVFTWFNLILVTLGVATLATGSVPDSAFLLVVLINTVVGTVQEVRAKRTLDRLALLNAPTARARRDGQVMRPVLLWRQLQVLDWRAAVRATTAGLVGMVPEGLVLLTTLAFFTAAVRLSRRRVLVQELPSVESLARVDELCTDKTGTLTQGRVTWGDLVLPPDGPAAGAPALPARAEVEAALGALAAVQEENPTMAAIRNASEIRPPSGWGPWRQCRSIRPASGAAPPSPATAHGYWERPRW
jgi:magnesium-transporting ATPase (P-type)